MAAQARFRQNALPGAKRRNVITAVKGGGMERLNMALLAQERGPDLQEPGLA